MQCVSTVSYSFLFNDEVVSQVSPERGIRQGDPLSPYIFIICGEILSGLCKKAQIYGSLLSIKIAKNNPKINHLLFADDTMFFTTTDPHSCSSLVTILQRYEQDSWQKINVMKSSISFSSKTLSETRLSVKQQLGIEKEGGVRKYIGLPEHFGRKKRDLFSSIVDKIYQRSISWSAQILSTDGKATMQQYMLSPIPNFAMSCFLLPLGLCKKIQSVLIRFWWDSKAGVHKIWWLSWDKLTQPKSLGGLGFRDIEAFNIALLTKIAWRLITAPYSLFSRIILGKYCHKTSFLKVSAGYVISMDGEVFSKGVILLQHLGKAIGDGEYTNLWNDSWMQPKTNLKPYGPVFLLDKDLMVSDILTRETKEWNLERINNLLPELATHILSLRPSLLGTHDAYIWPLQQSGTYSVKSGYFAMRTTCSNPSSPPAVPTPLNWKKLIWNPPLLPKMKFFFWKVA